MSPGPFSLRKLLCRVARGRAVDEKDDEYEDIEVNLSHIPKFCAILREPLKGVCEEIVDKMWDADG